MCEKTISDAQDCTGCKMIVLFLIYTVNNIIYYCGRDIILISIELLR